jgi:hypothetical protein
VFGEVRGGEIGREEGGCEKRYRLRPQAMQMQGTIIAGKWRTGQNMTR